MNYEEIESWIKKLTKDEMTMNQIKQIEFGFSRGCVFPVAMVKVTSYAINHEGKKFFGGDTSNEAAMEVRWFSLSGDLKKWAEDHKIRLNNTIWINLDYDTCREAREGFGCIQVHSYALNSEGKRHFDGDQAAKKTCLIPLSYLP